MLCATTPSLSAGFAEIYDSIPQSELVSELRRIGVAEVLMADAVTYQAPKTGDSADGARLAGFLVWVRAGPECLLAAVKERHFYRPVYWASASELRTSC